MKNAYTLEAEGQTFRLRLTMAGQKSLRERYNEEALPFLLSCASDTERLCALLTVCLTWPGAENGVKDGAELYDLLVDAGWRGQERFAALAFDIGAHSGLLTDEQSAQLKETVGRICRDAFAGLNAKDESGNDRG